MNSTARRDTSIRVIPESAQRLSGIHGKSHWIPGLRHALHGFARNDITKQFPVCPMRLFFAVIPARRAGMHKCRKRQDVGSGQAGIHVNEAGEVPE